MTCAYTLLRGSVRSAVHQDTVEGLGQNGRPTLAHLAVVAQAQDRRQPDRNQPVGMDVTKIHGYAVRQPPWSAGLECQPRPGPGPGAPVAHDVRPGGEQRAQVAGTARSPFAAAPNRSAATR